MIFLGRIICIEVSCICLILCCFLVLNWVVYYFFLTTFFRTLVIGGAGSVMLELYGWESVFYISGILAVLWAYCMWKFMLKGEGNCSNISRKTRSIQ